MCFKNVTGGRVCEVCGWDFERDGSGFELRGSAAMRFVRQGREGALG